MDASPTRDTGPTDALAALHARPLFLAAALLAAMASRLLPHPPNFTPLGACALFGGACFADRRAAFALTLGSLALSDFLLGFHALSPVVYGCFTLQVVVGIRLRPRRRPLTIACATLLGSCLFFVITNGAFAFAVYPRTLVGLAECYAAAVPFFGYTLLGDMTFAALLFGTLAVAEGRLPALRELRAPLPA